MGAAAGALTNNAGNAGFADSHCGRHSGSFQEIVLHLFVGPLLHVSMELGDVSIMADSVITGERKYVLRSNLVGYRSARLAEHSHVNDEIRWWN